MCKFAHGLGELKEVPVDNVNRRLRKMLSSMAVEWLDFSRIRFVTFKREIHVFFQVQRQDVFHTCRIFP